MKRKSFRRILSTVLALCMVLAMMPTSVSASTTVTPSPNTGNSSVNSLEVEYFSSTLYNWDESAANAATATADYSSSITSGVLSTASTGTLWTITAVDGVENGYTVSTTIDGTEWYITWGGGNNPDAELTTTATTILITDATYNGSSVISLAVTSGSYPYLNYYSSSQGFGGWSSGAGSDTGSQFTLYASSETSTALTTSSITSGSQYYIKNTRASAYLTGTTSTSEGYEGKGFYFTGSGNKGDSVPSFSSWSGSEQNYMIYSGLAASNLSDTTNAPFNTDVVNAANLFATDGSNTDYTSVYTNVQVPFVYDSETGYYTLDSDAYGVYFSDPDNIADNGGVMSIADLPMGYYAYAGSYYYKCGFAPFNTPNESSVVSNYYETATGTRVTGYTITGESASGTSSNMTYGFGMVTEVDFQMTDDGQINGEDIIFEFSGDDDVWVYIDGVLVLDIGGTHDAITGTINFATGEVTLDAANYDYIGDKATGDTYSGTMSQTNLYTALNTTLTAFASQGTHTMTIYYMDRGQGRTNCLIRFNLPQEDSLSVTKEIADTYTDNTEIDEDTMANLSNIDFTFTLYNGKNSVVANESYSLYDADGNFVQTGSTDSAGTFTLKNGYTAVFNNVDLDEEGSWYVVENLSSSRWVTTSSYTATINGSTTTGSGDATSGTVTLTEDGTIGSDLSADSISYTFTNQYVKGADPDVDVYDETIVLDYGLPVEVDVTANDITTLYGKSISSDYSPSYKLELVGSTTTTTDDDGNEVTTVNTTEKYEGTYGYATINDDGNIVYTLTEDFCGIETVQYQYSVTVTVENEDGDKVQKTGSAIGTLTIIPATSVYYEEDFSATYGTDDSGNLTMTGNFISIATSNATFSTVSDDETYSTYQETGLVGTTTDSTYGTDEVYLDNLGDSYGTSLKVDTSDGSAQYKYTFTGMGTTIYGRVSSETAYIKVTINAVDEDGNESPTDTQLIDTINLVTATEEDGEETILDDTLYNIPIYQNNGLAYGTYVVRIYVYKEGTATGSRDSSGGEFYLDGIRVYKPMGDSTDDNDGYETAASAYATDGEANVAVVNIREKMVADDAEGYISDVFTLTDIDGEIIDVDTYNDIGPNEEFYLEEGYSLSFALVNWNSQNYKIYLGMKAPNGTAATVTFGSDSESTHTVTLNNSADCYYDISSYVEVETDEDGNTIGYVNIEGVSGLAALTNIKVTGVDAFELAYATDENVYDEGDDGATTAALYLTSTAYAASLSEEEEEEVAVFEPSSISVSCTYASKTKKATVNVVTSKDVSYVTINGEKATQKTVSGKYRFTLSYTKVAVGTTYEIIAYDADGVASQVYTVTAE